MKHIACLIVFLIGAVAGCSRERSAVEVCEHAWRDYGSKDGGSDKSHTEYVQSCISRFPDGGANSFEMDGAVIFIEREDDGADEDGREGFDPNAA
jgi:hypothetical protein